MRISKLVYGDGVTHLPCVIIVVLFTIMIFNAMTMTMVFSYLPQLIKSFGTSEVDTGYKAGLLASSLFIGRSLFSLGWGFLADTRGKKVTLLISATGLMLATLAFGFSKHYCWSVISRLIQGSFMGIVICTKSILVDLCDDTNMALGMSIVIAAFSVGLIVGPSIGGFLVFPANKYPNVFSKDSLFGQFGILLPNLIIVIGLAISIILVFFFVPRDKRKNFDETSYLLPSKNRNKRYCEESDDLLNEYTNSNVYCNYSIEKKADENISLYRDIQYFQLIEKNSNVTLETGCCHIIHWQAFKNSSFIKIFRSKECILSSVLYGTYSIVAIGYDELFPLYVATSSEYNGLSFSTSKIGIILLIVSVLLVSMQILVLPRIMGKFGPIRSFIVNSLILGILFPLTPTVASIQNRYLLWTCLVIITLLARICVVGNFLSVNIILNNSVEPALLGSANGLGLTLSSIGRTFAPTLFGSLFSWSLSNVKGVKENKNSLGFPFNQYFPFFMLSVFSVLNAALASRFPSSMNKKKESANNEGQCTSSMGENMNLITEDMKITKITVSRFKPI